MAATPPVSVVIPACNSQATIHQTISSVLSQTHQNLEIIVVNDGSTDNTLEIVSAIDETRLTVYSTTNQGPSFARNFGIERAISEYISFIDADDLWTSDKIAKQLEALSENNGAALAYSWVRHINMKGVVTTNMPKSQYSGVVLSELLQLNFLFCGSNALFRKSMLEAVGGFDEDLSWAEDTDCLIRLAEKYEFILVPEYHILYRQNPASLSSNVRRQAATSINVLNKAFDRLPKEYEKIKPISHANIYSWLALRATAGELSFRAGLLSLEFFLKFFLASPKEFISHLKLVALGLGRAIIAILLPKKMSNWIYVKLHRMIFSKEKSPE